MSKRGTLSAAVGVAALALAGASDVSAATKIVTHTTVVHTQTHVNVGHTPQFRATKTPTANTQFRKLNTSGGSGTSGLKFHKTTGPSSVHLNNPSNVHLNNPSNLHVSPTTLKATTNLKTPFTKLTPSKFNAVALQQNKFQFVKLGNNHIAPMWKMQKKIWSNGHWKIFVPFTAIGAVLIGGGYYYPDAYVGFARPYCSGLTPDGCHLNWQMVNFEDGGGDWQCVQYCPRPNALPPPQAAALVAPPPVPQGSCELTIYSEQNFAGTGVTTGEEQPTLSASGWQNQIASIQVKSGTWDFFSDENFTGNNMRLQPGPYQDLGPEWTKKISSFQCIQPGQ